MLRFDASGNDERFAVWEHAELLERVAAKEKLFSIEHEAVHLRETDPKPNSNFHELCFGSFALLRERADYAYHKICRECDLGGYDFWSQQREWVRAMFRAFFGRNDGLGWFSILTARRPATLRVIDDPTLVHAQGTAQFQARRRYENLEKRPLEIGGIQVPMRGLRWASHPDAPRRRARLTQVTVPRHVSSNRFSVENGYYEEQWYTLAQPGDDDVWLRKGRIPALGPRPYLKELVAVRTTIMLAFIEVSLSSSPWQSVFVVEIHPESGEVLSLRWDRSPLAIALLNDAPVDHQAICELLRKGCE